MSNSWDYPRILRLLKEATTAVTVPLERAHSLGYRSWPSIAATPVDVVTTDIHLLSVYLQGLTSSFNLDQCTLLSQLYGWLAGESIDPKGVKAEVNSSTDESYPMAVLRVLREFDLINDTSFASQWKDLLVEVAKGELADGSSAPWRNGEALCLLEDLLTEVMTGQITDKRCRHPHGWWLCNHVNGVLELLTLAGRELVQCNDQGVERDQTIARLGKHGEHLREVAESCISNFIFDLVTMDGGATRAQLDILHDLGPALGLVIPDDVFDREMGKNLENYAKERKDPMSAATLASYFTVASDRYCETRLTEYLGSGLVEIAKGILASGADNPQSTAWFSQFQKSVEHAGDTIFGVDDHGTATGECAEPRQQSSMKTTEIPLASHHDCSSEVAGAPGGSCVTSTLEEVLGELRSMIGLERVKADVEELTNLIKVQKLRESKGLPNSPISKHLVFSGNPGTGKSTVARILAKVYKELGAVSKGHLKEVDRAGLVAGYLGQTALKVQAVVSEALGGVLFIDEAYSLVEEGTDDSYGKEAIDTLLKMMEDNRDDLIVIVAGYTEKMSRFINANPGLRSRFNKYLHFDDYKPEQLCAIFEGFCGTSYSLTEEARGAINTVCERMYANRNENFGNARDVRNMFEQILSNQASRIVTLGDVDNDTLMEISAADVEPILHGVSTGGTTDADLASRRALT